VAIFECFALPKGEMTLMARMLNPSPGEIADRQTILILKIRHGEVKSALDSKPGNGLSGPTAKGISASKTQHFVDENEQLQKYLEDNWFSSVPPAVKQTYHELFGELATTNGQLWTREAEARTLRSETRNATVICRAGELMFEITLLNDKRAEFVQQINELFGVTVQEKVYV
jgi:hypothetical protein